MQYCGGTCHDQGHMVVAALHMAEDDSQPCNMSVIPTSNNLPLGRSSTNGRTRAHAAAPASKGSFFYFSYKKNEGQMSANILKSDLRWHTPLVPDNQCTANTSGVVSYLRSPLSINWHIKWKVAGASPPHHQYSYRGFDHNALR